MKSSILTFVIVLTTTINFSQSIFVPYKTGINGSVTDLELIPNPITQYSAPSLEELNQANIKSINIHSGDSIIFFSASLEPTGAALWIEKTYTFGIYIGQFYENVSVPNQNLIDTIITDENTPTLLYLKVELSGDIYWAKINIVEELGIDDIIVDNGLKVYPNPVNDVCFVMTNEIVNVYDLTGQLLFTNENEKNTSGEVKIDMNGFIPGMYIVKAGSSSFKVFKI